MNKLNSDDFKKSSNFSKEKSKVKFFNFNENALLNSNLANESNDSCQNDERIAQLLNEEYINKTKDLLSKYNNNKQKSFSLVDNEETIKHTLQALNDTDRLKKFEFMNKHFPHELKSQTKVLDSNKSKNTKII